MKKGMWKRYLFLSTLLATIMATAFVFIQKKQCQIAKLEEKRLCLLQQKQELLDQNEDLQEKIASQSDPKWLELMLKKHLGLVEKGQTKVIFEEILDSNVTKL